MSKSQQKVMFDLLFKNAKKKLGKKIKFMPKNSYFTFQKKH